MPQNVLNGDHVAEAQIANGDSPENDEDSADVHFDPIISLPLIEVSNNEEDEVEMIKLRAKLYRYDSSSKPAEWKERGTGEVKLLKHKTKHTVRVVMRRDKTLKICANHFITPFMELKPNCRNDRAWIWSVLADYADEQLKPELLAIRFANAENALAWKEAFEKAKRIVGLECEIYAGKTNPDDKKSDSDDDSSDISYSESSEDEQQNLEKDVKEKDVVKEDDSQDVKEEKSQGAERVTEKLEKLNVSQDGKD